MPAEFLKIVFLAVFILAVEAVAPGGTAGGQTNGVEVGGVPPENPADTNACKVAGFTIKGRYTGTLALPLKPGDLWTPDKQFEVLEAIKNAFQDDPLQQHLFDQEGEIGVFYVDVKEQKDQLTHTVKLTFEPLQVRL